MWPFRWYHSVVLSSLCRVDTGKPKECPVKWKLLFRSGTNFWVCGWNLKGPFKWKLLSSTFLWCSLLCCTRWDYCQPVDEILQCDHSNDTILAVLQTCGCGAVCFSIFYKTKFGIFFPTVWSKVLLEVYSLLEAFRLWRMKARCRQEKKNNRWDSRKLGKANLDVERVFWLILFLNCFDFKMKSMKRHNLGVVLQMLRKKKVVKMCQNLKIKRWSLTFTTNVNGKYSHVFAIFPPFFTFVVCCFQRKTYFRVCQQCELFIWSSTYT